MAIKKTQRISKTTTPVSATKKEIGGTRRSQRLEKAIQRKQKRDVAQPTASRTKVVSSPTTSRITTSSKALSAALKSRPSEKLPYAERTVKLQEWLSKYKGVLSKAENKDIVMELLKNDSEALSQLDQDEYTSAISELGSPSSLIKDLEKDSLQVKLEENEYTGTAEEEVNKINKWAEKYSEIFSRNPERFKNFEKILVNKKKELELYSKEKTKEANVKIIQDSLNKLTDQVTAAGANVKLKNEILMDYNEILTEFTKKTDKPIDASTLQEFSEQVDVAIADSKKDYQNWQKLNTSDALSFQSEVSKYSIDKVKDSQNFLDPFKTYNSSEIKAKYAKDPSYITETKSDGSFEIKKKPVSYVKYQSGLGDRRYIGANRNRYFSPYKQSGSYSSHIISFNKDGKVTGEVYNQVIRTGTTDGTGKYYWNGRSRTGRTEQIWNSVVPTKKISYTSKDGNTVLGNIEGYSKVISRKGNRGDYSTFRMSKTFDADLSKQNYKSYISDDYIVKYDKSGEMLSYQELDEDDPRKQFSFKDGKLTSAIIFDEGRWEEKFYFDEFQRLTSYKDRDQDSGEYKEKKTFDYEKGTGTFTDYDDGEKDEVVVKDLFSGTTLSEKDYVTTQDRERQAQRDEEERIRNITETGTVTQTIVRDGETTLIYSDGTAITYDSSGRVNSSGDDLSSAIGSGDYTLSTGDVESERFLAEHQASVKYNEAMKKIAGGNLLSTDETFTLLAGGSIDSVEKMNEYLGSIGRDKEQIERARTILDYNSQAQAAKDFEIFEKTQKDISKKIDRNVETFSYKEKVSELDPDLRQGLPTDINFEKLTSTQKSEIDRLFKLDQATDVITGIERKQSKIKTGDGLMGINALQSLLPEEKRKSYDTPVVDTKKQAQEIQALEIEKIAAQSKQYDFLQEIDKIQKERKSIVEDLEKAETKIGFDSLREDTYAMSPTEYVKYKGGLEKDIDVARGEFVEKVDIWGETFKAPVKKTAQFMERFGQWKEGFKLKTPEQRQEEFVGEYDTGFRDEKITVPESWETISRADPVKTSEELGFLAGSAATFSKGIQTGGSVIRAGGEAIEEYGKESERLLEQSRLESIKSTEPQGPFDVLKEDNRLFKPATDIFLGKGESYGDPSLSDFTSRLPTGMGNILVGFGSELEERPGSAIIELGVSAAISGGAATALKGVATAQKAAKLAKPVSKVGKAAQKATVLTTKGIEKTAMLAGKVDDYIEMGFAPLLAEEGERAEAFGRGLVYVGAGELGSRAGVMGLKAIDQFRTDKGIFSPESVETGLLLRTRTKDFDLSDWGLKVTGDKTQIGPYKTERVIPKAKAKEITTELRKAQVETISPRAKYPTKVVTTKGFEGQRVATQKIQDLGGPEAVAELGFLAKTDIAPKMRGLTKFDLGFKSTDLGAGERTLQQLATSGKSYYGGERIKVTEGQILKEGTVKKITPEGEIEVSPESVESLPFKTTDSYSEGYFMFETPRTGEVRRADLFGTKTVISKELPSGETFVEDIFGSTKKPKAIVKESENVFGKEPTVYFETSKGVEAVPRSDIDEAGLQKMSADLVSTRPKEVEVKGRIQEFEKVSGEVSGRGALAKGTEVQSKVTDVAEVETSVRFAREAEAQLDIAPKMEGSVLGDLDYSITRSKAEGGILSSKLDPESKDVFRPEKKTTTFYHGTSPENIGQIQEMGYLREGTFVSKSKKLAQKYSKLKGGEGQYLEIELSEADFRKAPKSNQYQLTEKYSFKTTRPVGEIDDIVTLKDEFLLPEASAEDAVDVLSQRKVEGYAQTYGGEKVEIGDPRFESTRSRAGFGPDVDMKDLFVRSAETKLKTIAQRAPPLVTRKPKAKITDILGGPLKSKKAQSQLLTLKATESFKSDPVGIKVGEQVKRIETKGPDGAETISSSKSRFEDLTPEQKRLRQYRRPEIKFPEGQKDMTDPSLFIEAKSPTVSKSPGRIKILSDLSYSPLKAVDRKRQLDYEKAKFQRDLKQYEQQRRKELQKDIDLSEDLITADRFKEAQVYKYKTKQDTTVKQYQTQVDVQALTPALDQITAPKVVQKVRTARIKAPEGYKFDSFNFKAPEIKPPEIVKPVDLAFELPKQKKSPRKRAKRGYKYGERQFKVLELVKQRKRDPAKSLKGWSFL